MSKNFESSQKFRINTLVVIKYFPKLKEHKNTTFDEFLIYFENFFNFCFELPLDNMLKELKIIKYNMAVPKRKTSISKKK